MLGSTAAIHKHSRAGRYAADPLWRHMSGTGIGQGRKCGPGVQSTRKKGCKRLAKRRMRDDAHGWLEPQAVL